MIDPIACAAYLRHLAQERWAEMLNHAACSCVDPMPAQMAERVRCADDVEVISGRIKELAEERARERVRCGQQCKIRTEGGSKGCWCIGSREDGSNWACPAN